MLRSCLAVLGCLAAFGAHAQTAEPAASWTGFYVGANAGIAHGDAASVTGSPGRYQSFPQQPTWWGGYGSVSVFVANPAETIGNGRIAPATSLLGGGQAGYNHQIGQMVFGVEADLQAASRSRSSDDTQRSFSLGCNLACSAIGEYRVNVSTTRELTRDHQYLGTARGRVGYLVSPSLLAFATAGLAYSGMREVFRFEQNGRTLTTRRGGGGEVGYIVGGGLEYALDRSWSVKGEGLYYDFGTTRREGSVIGYYGPPVSKLVVAGSYRDKFDGHGVIGRIGLNYRFGD